MPASLVSAQPSVPLEWSGAFLMAKGTMRPERFHALVALTLALIGTELWLWLFHHTWHWYQVLAGWLIAVNLTTFGYYGYDKACARRLARRVPEVVLHGLALVGADVTRQEDINHLVTRCEAAFGP